MIKMQKSSKADKFGIAVILAAALYFIFSGGPSGNAGPNPDISKATFQGDWPFTVDQGRVYCTHKQELVFVANGNGAHYALNGIAQNNYDSIDPIWKQKGVVKVSLSGVIQHAQKFCP